LKELRFALLGCGDIGRLNAASLSGAGSCRLVKIADVNPEALASLPSEYQKRATTDVEQTLASSEVDAVFIATPHHLHAPLVCQAAGHGKHIVMEKPIAPTLEEAERMAECCRKAGVAFSVCHPRRYDPLVEQARAYVVSGRIGTPRLYFSTFLKGKGISYWEGGTAGRVFSGWRKSKKTSGGGVLMMNGVHQIDAMRSILGERVVKVHSVVKNLGTPVEVEDTAAVTLQFEGGALGMLLGCTLSAIGHKIEDRLTGTEGEIVLRPKELELHAGGGAKQAETLRLPKPEAAPIDVSKVRFLEAFAKAVSQGQRPPVPAEYGCEILKIVDAAYRSAEEENTVEF
jgi:predicted dehydrogenase